MTTSGFGPLSKFTGAFSTPQNSPGLNAIFRPQSTQTPTVAGGSNNVLELNVTREILTFLNTVGDLGVPVNRGSVQGDITLAPVFYNYYVEDASVPKTLANVAAGKPVIHEEVGMWILSPATTDPAEPATVQRLGSIPHGVAFNMQGTYSTISGPPVIPPMNCSDSTVPTGIQPFITGSNPPQMVPTPSLTAATQGTARLPQDLTSYIKAGTITQAILSDPNTLLRQQIAKQNISSTTIIKVDTQPAAPLFGGGVTNTAFLLSNAACTRIRSTWYIETLNLGLLGSWPQIQYTQEVFLDFDGITFPHMTVATLQIDPLPPPLLL